MRVGLISAVAAVVSTALLPPPAAAGGWTPPSTSEPAVLASADRPDSRAPGDFFAPVLSVTPGPLDARENPVIYPRSTQVRDVLHLAVGAHGVEDAQNVSGQSARRVTLTIRDRRGRVVFRRVERDLEATGGLAPYFTQRWTARRHGRALPAGRYRAVAHGVDHSGNRGTHVREIWVSADRLEWRKRTFARPAAATAKEYCEWLDDCGGGSPPECGTVVPSRLYAGGLSYRSRECSDTGEGAFAHNLHHHPVPAAAPRGVAAAKVAFSGAPTTAGETDQGTLTVRGQEQDAPPVGASGSTRAETAWVRRPEGHLAFLTVWDEDVPPGVIWSFATHGTSSVDVRRFVVKVRFLAVAD